MKINTGTNQGRCADGTCTNDELRKSGCFLCSRNESGDEYCVTCVEDHIVYNGTCVGCLSMEVCGFNNSDVVYCVDDVDLSHCNTSNNPTNCSDHFCLYENCGNGVVDGNEECEIGGVGCRGCVVCMDGIQIIHMTVILYVGMGT